MQKGGLCDKGPSEYCTTKKNLLPLAAALPEDVSVGAVAGCSPLPVPHAVSLCLHHCCYYVQGLILGFLALACSPPGTEYVIQNGTTWHLLLCSFEEVSYFNLSSNVVLSAVSGGGNEIRMKPSD